MLQKIDIYGQKVELKHNGRSTYNTSTGGLLTILSLFLFSSCMVMKVFERQIIESQFQAPMTEVHRRVLADDAAADSGEASSPSDSMNVFDYGIQSIDLIMN